MTAIDVRHQTFQAVAITTNRRDVLQALTTDALGFFGRGPLLLTDVNVATHITEQGVPAYLASAEFTCTE